MCDQAAACSRASGRHAVERTDTISSISDDEISVWSSACEMDQPTSGPELDETLVPELEGDLGNLKLSSEGELRKAKNRGKKLKKKPCSKLRRLQS